MGREQFIAQTVDRSMFGLEVGPGYAPTFPKSRGWKVETLDHATAKDLREKYRNMVGVDQIEHVDYVSDGRPMHEIIESRAAYDFIYASHVIEHVTDPISFFQSCEILLKEGGKLILVIPDKRRCFDALQAISTTGDFLDAYQRKASRHTPGRAFDFIANTTSLDEHGIWERHWSGEFKLTNTIDVAAGVFERAMSVPDYIDIHAWRFTPSSFRLIMQDLSQLKIIELREDVFLPSHTMEFYFSCTRTSNHVPIDRMELHRHLAREQIEGYQHVLLE